MTVLLVALGAAVGAPTRYLVDRWLRARYGFPWGTLLVNVAGSFLLGFVVCLPVSTPAAALLGTGFCGALTTYSTFGYETLRLARVRALTYVLASVTLGVAAAGAGAALALLLRR